MAEQCTYPKYTTNGVSTRGSISTNMGNNPRGTSFKEDFYSGKKEKATGKIKQGK